MYEKELNAMIKAAQAAAPVIMKIYNEGFAVEIKEDNSPVTLADKTADRMISSQLKEAFPDYGMLTEESIDTKERLSKEYIFAVDPVDGTKDFVKKDGMFTTNIGLIRNHEVVAGVVYIPARKEYYYGVRNQGAYYVKEGSQPVRIHVNDKTDHLIMLTSVFHQTKEEMDIHDAHIEKFDRIEKWGSAIKACRIAHGLAEVSYRLGPGTKEWDTAASQIIVLEAGGIFTEPNFTPIHYNREDVYNRRGFIILNRKENMF